MEATTTSSSTATPALEEVQARHRKELKDLQGRITSKKKNASKKTRKGVNDECEAMERELREKQTAEIAALSADVEPLESDIIALSDDEEESRADASPETGEGKVGKMAGKAEEKLEKMAEKLHIGGGIGESKESTTSASAQGQTPPALKRNRQKERLARRAAEQEAAAIKAEEEASNMTDHRAKESEYMKKQFAAHSLQEKDIDPDGHCLFSAVADQLSQNAIPFQTSNPTSASEPDGSNAQEPAYKTIRREASSYMLAHADDFAPFLALNDSGNGGAEEEAHDMETYAAKMRDTAEWGGQLELMALARRYEVEIRVVQDGRTERIGEEEGQGGQVGEKKVLWLAYYRHGYGLGEHYNSLRKV